MALNTDNLSPASVGSSILPTVWNYKTTDNVTDLDVTDYWGGSLAQMKAGDFVLAKCADGGALVCVTAIDQDAGTSTAAIVGSGGNGGQVWVSIACSGYGTAGAVGYGVAPIAGTITKIKHVLTTVVDADVTLNLDIGGTNVTTAAALVIASSGVAVGDIDTALANANNTVTENALIKVESDGGGSAGAGTVLVLITP